MAGKLITAERIHNGTHWLPPDATIEVAEDGIIKAIHFDPQLRKNAVFYDGVLSPAFVNVHCHLELSHMRGRIPRETGLIPFLQHVAVSRNDYTEEEKKTARHRAYHDLHGRGVIAVGDIANTTDAMDLRALEMMHVHSFVECIGFTETHAQQRFDYSERICRQYQAQVSDQKILRQTVVPHAPYSVSGTLFQLIAEAAGSNVVSIHNQETPAEDQFYRHKSGKVIELLEGLGIDHSFFQSTGYSSLQSYLPYFHDATPLIFVHNTYTSAEDVAFARSSIKSCFWCLCPNANLYIENRLPDVQMLMAATDDKICVGTDSLASNDRLCVLSELHTLKAQFPELSWERLLRWATANGADALDMPGIGRLEPGTRPGIIQILDEQQVVWCVPG